MDRLRGLPVPTPRALDVACGNPPPPDADTPVAARDQGVSGAPPPTICATRLPLIRLMTKARRHSKGIWPHLLALDGRPLRADAGVACECPRQRMCTSQSGHPARPFAQFPLLVEALVMPHRVAFANVFCPSRRVVPIARTIRVVSAKFNRHLLVQ